MSRVPWCVDTTTDLPTSRTGFARAWPALLGCAGCLLALALLAWLALAADPAERLDLALLRAVSDHGQPHLAAQAEALTRLGDPGATLFGAGLIFVLALLSRRPRHAAAGLAVVAGASLTTLWLKGALAQPRPYVDFHLKQIVVEAFPSGHATATAALGLALVLAAAPAWRPFAIAVAACTVVAVGVALVALVDHFPSDVLGGWLVAAAWACAALAVLRLLEPRKLTPPRTR